LIYGAAFDTFYENTTGVLVSVLLAQAGLAIYSIYGWPFIRDGLLNYLNTTMMLA
jgi:hypothetical protein